MNDISQDPRQVLRTVIETDNDALSELDEECGPTKTCRNMVGITFDGFAEPGSDIGAAWRQKLAREGKLRTSGESLRDFVMRSPDQL